MTGKVSKTPSRFSLTSIKSGAMPIRISMNGEDLGEVEEQTVVRMFSEGAIDRTAHYWMEGMPEWRPITEILVEADSLPPLPDGVIAPPSPRSKKSLTKAQITFLTKRGLPYEGLGRPQVEALIAQTKAAEVQEKERRNAEAEARMAEERRLSLLPTPKQLAYLDYHRVKHDASLTKQDARELIDATIKKYPDSQWNRVKHILRPDLYEFEEGEAYYKKQMDEAQQHLATLKSSGVAPPEEVEWAKEALYDAKQALEDYKEEFSGTIDEWDDRFTQDEYMDMDEEAVPFMQVFKKPSKTQIRAILERFERHYRLPIDSITLDEFFLVYHKLYPDSFKKGRSASFNVDDITIEPFYEKPEKKSRSGTGSPAASVASSSQAGPKKRGCISQIFRGIIIAIGLLFGLGLLMALLR
jgi:hypothetical protein